MPETIQPTPIRYTTRGFVYRRFSFKERLQILIGYSLLAEIHFASQHNPGKSQPITRFHVTSSTSEASALIEIRKQATAEQKAKGVEPNQLPSKK